MGCPQMGSSPLARGTQQTRHGEQYPPGLIPARAGNTSEGRSAGVVSGAHPRSRGEHDVAFQWVMST